MKSYIKKCREEAGLTQQELADKMEVSVISVQNWERGKSKPELNKYIKLSTIFNVSVDDLIKEALIEENQNRPDNWPDFLFEDETNEIINTLHLNMAQQDLFGLLYIYDSEYLKKTEIDFNTLEEDLKRIPYGFIDKVGSIRFLNQVEGLHKVIKYVKTDFLLKVLKQNPEAEFDIRKLTKKQICEFLEDGSKDINDLVDYSDDPKRYEGDCNPLPGIDFEAARIVLPVLEKNGPIHITDGHGYPDKLDITEEVRSAMEKCIDNSGVYLRGKYHDGFLFVNAQVRVMRMTDYHNISPKGETEKWIWEINERGKKLLRWLEEGENVKNETKRT